MYYKSLEISNIIIKLHISDWYFYPIEYFSRMARYLATDDDNFNVTIQQIHMYDAFQNNNTLQSS